MKYENGRTEEQEKMIMTRDNDMVEEDMHDRWKKNKERRHEERHNRFPEDNTVGRITISR